MKARDLVTRVTYERVLSSRQNAAQLLIPADHGNRFAEVSRSKRWLTGFRHAAPGSNHKFSTAITKSWGPSNTGAHFSIKCAVTGTGDSDGE